MIYPKVFIIRGANIALLVMIFLLPAYGQLNESDTMNLQIRIGVNGIRQTGNVELGILRSRTEILTRMSKNIVLKSQNNTLYQEFGRRKADNDIHSRNYIYLKPDRRLYGFGIAYLQSNYRLKIHYRGFAGMGITWQFIRKHKHVIKLSGSLVYEKTQYHATIFNKSIYNGSEVIFIWRPTIYISGIHRFKDQKSRFYYSAYWQPGIDRVSNQRFQAETGLDFNIWKGLSFSIQYIFIQETVVPIRVKQQDDMITVGITYYLKK
jgi:hypothetical protein